MVKIGYVVVRGSAYGGTLSCTLEQRVTLGGFLSTD